MKKLIVLSSMWLSFSSLAAGFITLEGEVRAFTTTQIQLNDGLVIYTIDKEKLSLGDQQNLKKIKVGAKMTMQVPFTAVTAVKEASAK